MWSAGRNNEIKTGIRSFPQDFEKSGCYIKELQGQIIAVAFENDMAVTSAILWLQFVLFISNQLWF